ncbi:zinc finger protein 442 [Caerostris extrusa]|uniref:Zinc finger protein 442 n=1 Tax=Caerostris extrusa TaxID=172846 RepID=A0AAV4YDM4_CAEEX|nr:zinc finger protein 442 [Caerostris extrusa]
MADSVQDVYTLQIRRQKNCSVSPYCEACKTGCIHVNSIQKLQIRHLTQNEHQPHLCSKCGKSFTHAGNHRKHMLLHERDDTEGVNGIKSPLNHPKPPFKCEKCDRNFLKYGSFTKHILSHDQKFICGMCDKAFNTKQLLKGHMHSHKIDLPFHPCKFCKATFQIPEELEKHLVEHVQNQNEELQNEPNEIESEPEIDTEPKVINESKVRHICSYCQKGFVNLGALKNHFSFHTGNLPFKCEICNRKFMHAFNLKKHMQIHFKNSFNCVDCEKSFKNARQLRTHSFDS